MCEAKLISEAHVTAQSTANVITQGREALAEWDV